MSEIRVNLARYQLFDFFEFLVGVLSLISSLLAVWTFFTVSGSVVLTLSILAVIALSIVFFIKILKLRKVSQDRLFVFAETYHKYNDLLRDEYYTLRQLFQSGELTTSRLRNHAQSTGQRCVDLLANVLSVATAEKVSVCIKYFPDDQPRPFPSTLQEEEYHVKTLCRSFNTAAERASDTLASVKTNTDFLVIMNERRGYFRAQDLRELDRQLKASGSVRYLNSNHNWEDHYLATIVVPIRIRQQLLESNSLPSDYDLLGFLCADSLSTSAFRKSEIDAYTDLMRAFAAGLYVYLDRVYSYLQELNSRRKEE